MGCIWFDVCWCYVAVWLWWCGVRMQASVASKWSLFTQLSNDAQPNKHKIKADVWYKAMICVRLGQEHHLNCTGTKNHVMLWHITSSYVETAKLLHGETKSWKKMKLSTPMHREACTVRKIMIGSLWFYIDKLNDKKKKNILSVCQKQYSDTSANEYGSC